MEITSCEIETKYKCKVILDFKDIDKEYIVKDGKPYLASNKSFDAIFRNGNKFNGYILFTDQKPNCKSLYVIMTEKNFKIKDIVSIFDFEINGVRKSGSVKGEEIKFNNQNFKSYGPKINLKDIGGKFSACNGFIEIEFQPTSRVIIKEELKGLMYQESFGSEAKDLDFALICQDKSFHFNKHLLCTISNVFKKMIETSECEEAKSGSVCIVDFSPDTIEAFKKVVFGNDVSLDEEDLTVKLLMFANKYCISPLVRVVAHHLRKNLSFENIFQVIEAAYLIDDDDLLEDSANFILGNSKNFKTDEKWKRFKDQHPKCAVKLLDFMMFTKLN